MWKQPLRLLQFMNVFWARAASGRVWRWVFVEFGAPQWNQLEKVEIQTAWLNNFVFYSAPPIIQHDISLRKSFSPAQFYNLSELTQAGKHLFSPPIETKDLNKIVNSFMWHIWTLRFLIFVYLEMKVWLFSSGVPEQNMLPCRLEHERNQF